MSGVVSYIGHANSYDIALADRVVNVKKNASITVPLWKCKELIEKADHFVPDAKTAEILGKYTWSSINDLKKMISGRRMFIIGSGPSLKGFNFSRLDGDFTITTNHASRYYLKSKMIMFLDRKFVRECKDSFIDKYEGILFASYRADYDKSKSRAKAIYCFPTNRREITPDLNMGLFNGELTGLCALNLALILGASPIYLLGFDMNRKPPWYFFEDEFTVNKRYKESKVDRCLKYFNKFDGLNRIYNCSINSNIKNFEFRDIEKVLK